MFNCSDEVFLELAWKHKLQQVCRFLLHDLSNYLTGSLALSELCCLDTTSGSTEDMISIRDNCYKERELIMRLSQLNHPKMNALTYIDLKSFLNDLIPIFRCILPSHVDLSFEANDISTRIIQFKPEFLHRIFIQLIFNSAEALKNVVEPKIKIIGTIEEEKLTCLIEDNGCGIPQQILQEIEQPMTSLQPKDDLHLGLGLYMVRYYLTIMNSAFTIKSEENKGTQVKIYFPSLA